MMKECTTNATYIYRIFKTMSKRKNIFESFAQNDAQEFFTLMMIFYIIQLKEK